ncbi:methyl-accepting chemotaxis protein [Methylobacterium sp. R2-1]|uniref:methyl-accepting chemotaxis protein n=1 Tax=Methylobacterium sp. R2-1 TaxID=2587064 RepID=UPI0016190C18|nr:MCP four helix bundle domain-containing protein [Methylobacterium sp. R2-1]MBB2965212.1 methyl-accepting chemotaxis protein [Methylobacterium sp. R2-1]
MQAMSIRAKLIGAFLVLTLFTVGLGVLGISSLSKVQGLLIDVQTNWLPSVRGAASMDIGAGRQTTSLMRNLLTAKEPMFTEVEKDLAERNKKMDELIAAYASLISSDRERALYEEFRKDWQAFIAATQPILELSRKNEKAKALELYETQALGPRRKASASLVKLVDLNDAGAANAQKQAEIIYAESKLIASAAALSAVLLSVLIGALIIRSISRGITSVIVPMQALAAGDLSVNVPHRGAKTEIGKIADAVQVFKDALIRMKALEEETALARASAEEQRKAGMHQMADSFEQAVGGIIGLVSSSSTELQATAQTLTATATQTASQSTTVAAAAEEAASNVSTVAAAAEQLGSSVQEIGRQVNGSAQLAQAAVSEAAQTAGLVQDLSGAVAKIDDVVTMISTIAGQTNLLALNATIEAARAGEAGRGFAVVAAEVKELANQTARATEEISSQITRIQGSTGQAVSAIGSITARIQEISGVATAIAAAVEEQGAATQEIVRNVAQAAMGTGEVTNNIAGVAGAAEETGAAASQVLGAASELSRQSEHLSAEVSRFLATVRAA